MGNDESKPQQRQQQQRSAAPPEDQTAVAFSYTAFSVDKSSPQSEEDTQQSPQHRRPELPGTDGVGHQIITRLYNVGGTTRPLIAASEQPWTFSPSGHSTLDNIDDAAAIAFLTELQGYLRKSQLVVSGRQTELQNRVGEVERLCAATIHSYCKGHAREGEQQLAGYIGELERSVSHCFNTVSKLVDLTAMVRSCLPETNRKALDQGSTLYRVRSSTDDSAAALHAVKQLGTPHKKDSEMTREWLDKLLPNWEQSDASRGFKRRVALARRGIPVSLRGMVWTRAIGNPLQISDADHEFEVCFRRAELNKDQSEHSMDLIQHDLPRTFHSLGLFKDSHEAFSVDLKRVLQAVACFNTHLGYVQGMSYVGAMLLVNMSAPEAWSAFVNMLHWHFFQSLYSMDMVELMKHLRVYEMILSESVPEVWHHFQQLSVSTTHYALDWFMTLLTKKLPLQIAARIWDCFMVEGEIYLFRAAAGICKYEQEALLACDFEGACKTLKNPLGDVGPELIKCIQEIEINPMWISVINRIA